MSSKIEMNLQDGGDIYVNITGSTEGVMKLLVIMFEKQSITRKLFEDAIRYHDEFKKHQEEKLRKANEN